MKRQYRQCRAHLINAFLALEADIPEQDRLRQAIELLLEAVVRTERDDRLAKNVVQFHPRGA